MADPVLRCERVRKVYSEGETAVVAVDDVSLLLQPGEFVAMAGPSGSGKSTLLNLIGALDTPTAGEIWIGDRPLSGLSSAARADLRLHRLGFIFQSYNLIPVLTARENVEFVMQLQGIGGRERRTRALEMLSNLGLAELGDRRPAEMSGGQQQRVAVARALVTHPLLLLADEPSANLDSHTTDELLTLFARVNADFGTTILTATHDPRVIGFARRRLRLEDGRIAADTGNDAAA